MDTARPVELLLGFLEKVLWTYLEAFAALLLVGPSIDISTATAAAFAALPAAITFAMNALPPVPIGLPFWLDVVLRVARTFTASFLGYLVGLPVFSLDFGILTAAAMGAIPACLVILKAAAASRLGNPSSAATLPARLDPAALAAT